MTETELAALCAAITPPDEAARAAAHAHWASLAKPLGGLGALETVLEDAAALTGSAKLEFSHRAVLVLCADNGVVAQGVSQTDSSVTRAVAENLAARRTSVCRMAQTARCEVVPVDMGIAGDPVPGVLDGRFQSAQPAQRLCKAGPVGVRRRPGGFVRRRDGRTEGGEFFLSHGLSCNFQPRRQSAAAGAYPPSTNAGTPHRNARLQSRRPTACHWPWRR